MPYGPIYEPASYRPSQRKSLKSAEGLPFSNVGEELVVGEDGQAEIGEDGEPKTIWFPMTVAEIADSLAPIVGPWPKRVGNDLFVRGPRDRPVYLKTADQLIAWINRSAEVDWRRGDGKLVTQRVFFEDLAMRSEGYDAIENNPHWPPLPGVYYMHPPVPGPGGHLERLLDYFRPSTPVDRELIRAFILTLFWGGPPGCRPAFLITGSDRDGGRGRGLGKTKLVDVLCEELVGGCVDVQPTEDIGRVKTRLLSGEARTKRVCRLDNLKTLRFSWADLVGLITASVISGHRLYAGNGERPNVLVWAITLNGASLSTDMVQRTVHIKLDRPPTSPTWESEVRRFIAENRPGILGDIKAALEGRQAGLGARTRWGPWEAGVLAACHDPEACQAEIVARQDVDNDENTEREIVSEHFRRRIEDSGHDPETSLLFIPSALTAAWLDEALREKHPTNKATNLLRGLGIPELEHKHMSDGNGWVWTGTQAPGDAQIRRLAPPPLPRPWTRATTEDFAHANTDE